MQLQSLQQLIKLISSLPNLGPRSARRIALFMLQNIDNTTIPMANLMLETSRRVSKCSICDNIDIISPCSICISQKRDSNILCIVENIADLWALERANFFNGKYHVLGGNISIIDGKTPDKLNISTLPNRVIKQKIQEVIIATGVTLEGQTTAHYIIDSLKNIDVKITKPAHGIPVGAELDYMDESTLALAIKMRKGF